MSVEDAAVLTSEGEVAEAIAASPRLAAWRVCDQGAGWLKVELAAPIRRATIRVIVAWPALWRDGAGLAEVMRREPATPVSPVLVADDDELAAAVEAGGGAVPLTAPVTALRLFVALRAAGETAVLRHVTAALEAQLGRAQSERELLISIGRALSQERNLRQLLELILRRAREVTGADAGSVWVVKGLDDDAKRELRFMVAQNDSREVETQGFTLPVSSSSIVGTCVMTSDVIHIDDLYGLDEPGTGNNPWGFVHDRSFDERNAYQTHSMLTVPMISARDQVIGVIQLINKRAAGFTALRGEADFMAGVVAFDEESVSFATSLASQAGIALENAALYDEVKTLFEGFVRASVTAIEARDPTTSGHSERVAELTVALANAVSRDDTGQYRDLTFSADELTQLEYAALLHDFGKVGVREHVLVKAKKLYEHERELILQRFHFIRRGFEVEGLRRKVEYLTAASRDQLAPELAAADRDAEARLRELDELITVILAANEPTVLAEGGFARIADIAGRTYLGIDGESRPYLTEREAHALQIMRGSLSEGERHEINSHVVHTYNFLRQIPWGRTFRDVPEIAGGHHEKLDGTGYPQGRRGAQISVPTRMMTISDIYDALTARDRPYKRAIPAERALDILGSEVKAGLLDAELYRIFVESKVWEMTVAAQPNRRSRWSTSPVILR